jgi:SAM-dependent methyltransferase
VSTKTWEQAVEWLRQQPDQVDLVRACYYDDPLLQAAERFAQSGEWKATANLLPAIPGKALDIGAGRGISSYALAKLGWRVTALEPDPSSLVGAEAIRQLAKEAHLEIQVIEEYGETLPFETNSLDVVLARQVLHHARDLNQLCCEIARVLKPNGWMIATREHVISKRQDLQKFLDKHPLHHLYGGENAFLLVEYIDAITSAGLTLTHVWGPLESEINAFPMTEAQRYEAVIAPLVRRIGHPITRLLTHPSTLWGKWSFGQLAKLVSKRDQSPGRLYSFVASKS